MTQALQFFQEKQKEDPNFFYRIVIDEDKKVKHMFWADGTSLKYYEMYGDYVTPGFRRQTECEPCTCQDQQFTYMAVT
jgi:hypothetical protein